MIRLSPTQLALVNALADGRVKRWSALVCAVYGHKPSGGPEDPERNLAVHLSHLRAKGFRFVNAWGVGVRLAYDPRRQLIEGDRWLGVDDRPPARAAE